MRRRALLHAAEAAVVAVIALVLPTTISSPGLYLVCAVPCLLAAIVLGYLDGRGRG